MTQKDLLDAVDFSVLECLNEQPAHAVANILKQGYREDDGLFLESEADEQLLINVVFNTPVKVHSFVMKAPTDGSGPRQIKLYVNRPTMGFSDVDNLTSAQDLVLDEAQLSGEQAIVLKYVKFQNVNVLSLFIESNQGGTETTKISKLMLFGNTGETMNVADIKKQEHK